MPISTSQTREKSAHGGRMGPPEPGTPLYVHLPFCVELCPYCDFFSVRGEGQDQGKLVERVLAEARIVGLEGLAPRTVFLGGGTPSHLDGASLVRLFDGLDALTGFRASATEVTVECNPESLDQEKARLLVSLGANRLSIGLQALQQDLLTRLGRVHGVERGLEAVASARATGAAVSMDLIYAIPGQELAAWEADLGTALEQGPDHVSAYLLTFEPGTPFDRLRREGTLVPLPSETQRDFLDATHAALSGAGLPAYEVSNFASTSNQCGHNVNYWRNGPYVGLGPSAVSRVGWSRTGNPRSLGAWAGAIARGEDPCEWTDTPSPATRLGETWWLGLRMLSGVDPSEARAVAGWGDAPDPTLATREHLAKHELLEEVGSRWRLTAAGMPLADGIARDLLSACAESG